MKRNDKKENLYGWLVEFIIPALVFVGFFAPLFIAYIH